MLRLLFFIVVAVAVALAAVWFANHPGNVMVEFEGRQVQTSVGMLLLAFLAVGAVVTLLVELLRWLGGLPRRIRQSQRHAREVRGYQALTRGMVEAAAGNIGAARSLHQEAERLLPDRGSVLLLAAQTAQLEGREEVAHLKFRQMLRSPETELLGLRGLLAQAMKVGDRDEALGLAKRAYRRSPTTPWVLNTLFDLLARTQRWQEALALTGELQAQKLLAPAQAQRQRGILEHLVATWLRDGNQPQEAVRRARQAVKLVPDFPPAAVLAGELANQQGHRRRAQRTLEDAWRAEPHPDLARAYARLIETETPEQRLERVEVRLKPLRPDHPELHVAVGELAIAAGRYDRAREALERALALEPTQRVYRLLAELERAGGDPSRAQDWLQRAADAPPDRAWVCEDTGEVVPGWRPFGNSGRFDAVRWTLPPKVSTMFGSDHGPFLVADGRASRTSHDDDGPSDAEPPRRRDERGGNGHTSTTAAAMAPAASTAARGHGDEADRAAPPSGEPIDDDPLAQPRPATSAPAPTPSAGATAA
jgi:HemY protein